MGQTDKLLSNKSTPHFHLLPMFKVARPNYAFIRCRLYSDPKVLLYQNAGDVETSIYWIR